MFSMGIVSIGWGGGGGGGGGGEIPGFHDLRIN